MATYIPAHLSHKSALVLLSPSSISAPIEAVRRTCDKNFERWPAHINLLYPFLSEPSEPSGQGKDSNSALKPDIRARITRAIKDVRPFHMALNADAPEVFHHGHQGSRTVWLGPTTQNVQQLQAALQKEFSEVNADQRPFTPHLSVGQAKTKARVDKVKASIRKEVMGYTLLTSGLLENPGSTSLEEAIPTALNWHVDQVCVIERHDKNDRFKVVEAIKLGE
jgi:hypothetical protein